MWRVGALAPLSGSNFRNCRPVRTSTLAKTELPVGTCLTTSKTPTQFLPHSSPCSPDKPSAPSEPLLPSVLLLSERCPCGLLPLLLPTMASPPLLCLASTAPMPLLWYVFKYVIRRLGFLIRVLVFNWGRCDYRDTKKLAKGNRPLDEGIYCWRRHSQKR